MRPSRRRLVGLTLGLPCAFGVLGVMLSLLLPGGGSPAAQEPAPTSHVLPRREPPPRPPPASTSLQDERIRALEQKVAELSAQASRHDGKPAVPERPPRLDREQARQELLERQQAQLAAHQREPVDFVWSQAAHASFSADFSVLTRGESFQVKGLDCRTATCVVTVEWGNYAEASAGYPELLQYGYGMDCARSILLPEPENPDARYQASLVLDCQGRR